MLLSAASAAGSTKNVDVNEMIADARARSRFTHPSAHRALAVQNLHLGLVCENAPHHRTTEDDSVARTNRARQERCLDIVMRQTFHISMGRGCLTSLVGSLCPRPLPFAGSVHPPYRCATT